MYFQYGFTLKMNWRILFVHWSTSVPNVHWFDDCRMGCHRYGGVRFRRVFVRIEVYVAECACIESHSFQDNVMFSDDQYRSATEIKSIVVVKIRLITTEHSEELMIRIKIKRFQIFCIDTLIFFFVLGRHITRRSLMDSRADYTGEPESMSSAKSDDLYMIDDIPRRRAMTITISSHWSQIFKICILSRNVWNDVSYESYDLERRCVGSILNWRGNSFLFGSFEPEKTILLTWIFLCSCKICDCSFM